MLPHEALVLFVRRMVRTHEQLIAELDRLLDHGHDLLALGAVVEVEGHIAVRNHFIGQKVYISLDSPDTCHNLFFSI